MGQRIEYGKQAYPKPNKWGSKEDDLITCRQVLLSARVSRKAIKRGMARRLRKSGHAIARQELQEALFGHLDTIEKLWLNYLKPIMPKEEWEEMVLEVGILDEYGKSVVDKYWSDQT